MNKIISLMMIIAVISMVACEKATDDTIFSEFQKFMKEHKKVYTTIEEFKDRYEIFVQNFKRIEMQSLMMSQSQEPQLYKLALNEFADMTPKEFASTHLTLEISHLQRIKAAAQATTPHYKNGEAPLNYDWREQGKVSPVRDQGSCGSCWAFSAIGNIESVFAIKTGKMVDFSEQQLVDCDKVDQGCNGGLMEDAYKHLMTTGVMTAASYPYTGRDGTCRFNQTAVQANVTGFQYAASEDENVIKQFLYENGPLAIAINATPLQFYFGGVFNPWFQWICNPKSLDHGVLLVGYGVEGNTPYWIVKNSWGSGWGEKGYFRLVAGKGACGVNTYVITAQVEDVQTQN